MARPAWPLPVFLVCALLAAALGGCAAPAAQQGELPDRSQPPNRRPPRPACPSFDPAPAPGNPDLLALFNVTAAGRVRWASAENSLRNSTEGNFGFPLPMQLDGPELVHYRDCGNMTLAYMGAHALLFAVLEGDTSGSPSHGTISVSLNLAAFASPADAEKAASQPWVGCAIQPSPRGTSLTAKYHMVGDRYLAVLHAHSDALVEADQRAVVRETLAAGAAGGVLRPCVDPSQV